MHHRLLSLLLIPVMLIPAAPTAAVQVSPPGWTSRLVVTYASPLRGDLPAGVQEVRADGRRVVVDLGRRATRADLLRFRDPLIVAVEPDIRMKAAITPSDPSFPSQWDISDSGAGAADYSVRAPGAWEITTGSSDIVVAVLDTGITSHSEFTGRTVAGYDFVSYAQDANDGNGRDSDPSDPGDWITSSEAASEYFSGCDVSNSSWHGTHVAGTIGAAGNNASGIAGLNWTSKIQPIRVLGKCGGYNSDIQDAIRWAAGGTVTDVPMNATPARIISLSLGGFGACSTDMQGAIDEARSLGALVVVAAGNESENAAFFSPANCSGVITVAATGRNGKRAYYSNYGSTIEIAAPGGNSISDSKIYSTLNSGTKSPSTQSYGAYQGTSMATPHVAGVLSLLLSVDPTLDESDVLALLASTSTPFPSDGSANSCSTAGMCGPGIINATALITAAAPERAGQTINFPSIGARYVGDSPFVPGASSTSGLAVSYAASPSTICATNGELLTLKKAGSCLVTASQLGSAEFLPATPVSQSFTILSPARPSNSVSASLSGSPMVGTELTFTPGAWSGAPLPAVNSQWVLCTKSSKAVKPTTSSNLPSGCQLIGGATELTYTPVQSDAGKYLRVKETAVNAAASMTAYTATTAEVGSEPWSISPPPLSGNPKVGNSLSVKTGAFGGSKTIRYTYAWYACTTPVAWSSTLSAGCTEISGATASKYKLTSAALGKYMVARVTATNGYGSAVLFSASSTVVQ